MKPTHYIVRYSGRVELFARRMDARIFRARLALQGIRSTIEARGF
jgi:hypothetical protein